MEKTKKELVKKAKEIMNQKGEIVHQKNTFDVEEGKVYGLEMGHESGEIFYNIKDDGKWIFVSDRISEDLLPYYLQDTNGKLLQDEGKLKPVMEGSSSGFDKITYDPHSWLSVVNAKKYLNSIQDKLIQKYPDNKKIYHKNKLKYVDKLTDIDAEYKEKFSKLDNKSFLVTHYAYAYIARDFGLTQYPLEGLTSMESPSLKTIKKAVDFAKTKNITTVFYEYGKPPKEAKTLSEELGGDIKPLASMEFVNTCSRLIEYKKFWLVNHRPANHSSLLKSSRQFIYRTINIFFHTHFFHNFPSFVVMFFSCDFNHSKIFIQI